MIAHILRGWVITSLNLLVISCFQGKVTVTNEDLVIVYEEHVSYDNDLPEFGYVFPFFNPLYYGGFPHTCCYSEYVTAQSYDVFPSPLKV